MAEFEKGAISEEALDEIAGGINVDKEKLKKSLTIAGVAIVSASTLVGLAYGAKKAYDKHAKNIEAKNDMDYLNKLAKGYGDTSPENPYNS